METKTFVFTYEDLKDQFRDIEAMQEEIDNYHGQQLRAQGALLRLHVVKPFCKKFTLQFDTGMGSWSFRIAYLGKDYGKVWFVGEDRRPLPGRPEGPEGDEDKWWADVTDEEKYIKKLLDWADDGRANIGSWIENYPNSKGL